jgi:hypoxanthine phosphoribosyltransferase
MSKLEVLLSEEQIQQKVSELAATISQAYGQRTVHVIALLENGFMFMPDLVRQLTCPVVCQFVKVEMTDVVEQGHERRVVVHTPKLEVQGQDLLLADCVLHTGITLDHLVQQFLAKGAASVKTAVLVDKIDERRVALNPDFAGFQMQGRFLVGYGMGHREQYRNLPYVGTLTKDEARKSSPVSAAGQKAVSAAGQKKG